MSEIINDILSGKHDGEIEAIEGAIKDRMRTLGITKEANSKESWDDSDSHVPFDYAKFNSLKVGDTVVFNQSVKAKVMKKKVKNVSLQLLEQTGGRFDRGTFGCPISLFNKVEA